MTAAVGHSTVLTMEDGPLPDDLTATDVALGAALDDILKLTPATSPTPGQDMEPPYRCPVSTPANFVHPSPKVRRTKPMPVSVEINLTPRSPGKRSAGGKPPRPGGALHRTQSQQNASPNFFNPGGGQVGVGGGGGAGAVTGGGKPRRLLTPGFGSVRGSGVGSVPGALNGRTLDYYYVDKAGDQKEAAETNTFWLKALCSQPVHEILDKYRRRSELRRTRLIWTKTYTTPGERSLLQAWERNAPRILAPTIRGYLASATATATAHSLRQSHSKAPSQRSGASLQRRHYSEPFERSAAGFPSDDDDDNTEEEEEEEDNDDEETRVGEGSSSTVSADVSVSTPRYNRHPHSPTSSTGRHRQRHQHQQQQQHHQHLHPRPGKEEEGLMLFHERPANGEAMAGGRVHPVQPAYLVSDHQQVSLPMVQSPLPNHSGSRPVRERLSTPKTRATRLPFAHDATSRATRRAQVLHEAELSEASPRDSTTPSPGGPPTSIPTTSTQPATPRSVEMISASHLPAIVSRT